MFQANEIQARVHVRPFVPLRITTSAGQSFDVYHPDLILVGHREVTIGRASTAHPTQYDQLTRLAIMHITALEDLPIPQLPTGNGQQ